MLLGCLIGIIVGIFSPDSLLLSVSLGSGIGYLFGFLLMKFIARQGTIFPNPKGISGTVHSNHMKYVTVLYFCINVITLPFAYYTPLLLIFLSSPFAYPLFIFIGSISKVK